MHLLLPKALMVWLTPPDNWSIFLHIEVLSLLYLGETINSLFWVHLSQHFSWEQERAALESSPGLFPITEPSISLQRGLGRAWLDSVGNRDVRILCFLLSVQPGGRLELLPTKPLMCVCVRGKWERGQCKAAVPTVLYLQRPCCFADGQTAWVCMLKGF